MARAGRKTRSNKRTEHKRNLAWVAVIIASAAVAVLVISVLLSSPATGELIGIDGDRLWAVSDRGNVESSIVLVEENNNWTLQHVSFDSAGTPVYALLRVPVRDSLSPAFIILPASTVPKESAQEQALSELLVEMGYATLTIDQRNQGTGVGETGGAAVPLLVDYDNYAAGVIPVQALRVLDVLRAYDLLVEDPRIDDSRIFVIGESMGAQYALLATALEDGIGGVMLFSGAGFLGDYSNQPSGFRDFLSAVDPDNYLDIIEGKTIAFIHASGDPVVPFQMAMQRYDAAFQPKLFLDLDGTVHALYDRSVEAFVRQAVGFITG